MARQHGVLQLTGPIGNLSFYYHPQYGYLAREKSSGSGKKLSPRTLENAQELGEASRASKLIRRGINNGLRFKGDRTVQQRLNSCLSKVLRLDTVHRRGERTVATGLEHAEGRHLLRSFAFNGEVPFDSVLQAPVICDPETGNFVLTDFVSERDLGHYGSATHVQLQGVTVVADTAMDMYLSFATAPVVFPINAAEREVRLEAKTLPIGEGCRIAAMSVIFFEEVNGDLVEVRRFGGVLG